MGDESLLRISTGCETVPKGNSRRICLTTQTPFAFWICGGLEVEEKKWRRITGQKKTLPFEGKGFTTKSESAATYSPTKLPWQYHRR